MQLIASLISRGTEAITPGLRYLLLHRPFQLHPQWGPTYPKKCVAGPTKLKIPDTDEQFAIHSQCIHTTRTEFSMGPEMWAYRYRSLKSVTLTLFCVHLSITETTGSTPTPSQRLILFMSIHIFFKTSTGSFPRTEFVRKNHTRPH